MTSKQQQQQEKQQEKQLRPLAPTPEVTSVKHCLDEDNQPAEHKRSTPPGGTPSTTSVVRNVCTYAHFIPKYAL